mmetsp:Transcript_10124/g.22716  ORF Transcript_10124/g.22716 Transcript_10124/m.22716 type:complete len:209 (-) Transcript_10124:296-922(-)
MLLPLESLHHYGGHIFLRDACNAGNAVTESFASINEECIYIRDIAKDDGPCDHLCFWGRCHCGHHSSRSGGKDACCHVCCGSCCCDGSCRRGKRSCVAGCVRRLGCARGCSRACSCARCCCLGRCCGRGRGHCRGCSWARLIANRCARGEAGVAAGAVCRLLPRLPHAAGVAELFSVANAVAVRVSLTERRSPHRSCIPEGVPEEILW